MDPQVSREGPSLLSCSCPHGRLPLHLSLIPRGFVIACPSSRVLAPECLRADLQTQGPSCWWEGQVGVGSAVWGRAAEHLKQSYPTHVHLLHLPQRFCAVVSCMYKYQGEKSFIETLCCRKDTVKSGRLWSHTAWFSLLALIAVFGAVESLVP